MGYQGRGKKQYDNNLSGALFPNDRKNKDQDPDLVGSVEIEGVEYWISGWWNESKQRVEYLKIKLTLKEDNQQQQPQRGQRRGAPAPRGREQQYQEPQRGRSGNGSGTGSRNGGRQQYQDEGRDNGEPPFEDDGDVPF